MERFINASRTHPVPHLADENIAAPDKEAHGALHGLPELEGVHPVELGGQEGQEDGELTSSLVFVTLRLGFSDSSLGPLVISARMASFRIRGYVRHFW